MTFLRPLLVTSLGLVLFLPALARADDISGSTSRAAAIEQKLKSIVVSIDFNHATIDEAVQALSVLSKQRDPAQQGINFFLQPEAAAQAQPITLQLDRVPLQAALHYVCELGRVRDKIDDYSVAITPFSAGEDLVKRTFRVDPSFVESVSNAGVIPAPKTP
jgi:hypothetical protein